MKKSIIINSSLAVLITTVVGVNIFTRLPSLTKLGLGIISLGGIAAATKVNCNIALSKEIEYKSEIKALTSQLQFKDIEISNALKTQEELEKDYENKLVDLKQSHVQDLAIIKQECGLVCDDRIALLKKKHAIEINRIKAANEAEKAASNDVIAILRADKNKLLENIKLVQQESNEIKEETVNKVVAINQEIHNLNEARKLFAIEKKEWELKQMDVKLESRVALYNTTRSEEERLAQETHALRQAQIQHNAAVAETQNFIKQVTEENEYLKHQLAAYQTALNKNNGTFNTSSIEGHTADMLINWFARKQLPLSYKEGSASKISGALTLKFDAREDDRKKIIKEADFLSEDMFGGKPVSIKPEDGYLKFTVPHEPQATVGKVCHDPSKIDFGQLNEMILSSNHFIVFGSTGDGKTTLISNVIEIAGELFEDPELQILNPKPSEVEFYFRGQRRFSTYLNTSKPSGCTTPSCRDGLEQLNLLLKERMAVAQRLEEKNKKRIQKDPNAELLPMPDFKPMLVVIFECNYLRAAKDEDGSELKDLFDEVVFNLSKIGREYKLITVLEGQETACGQWGMNRAGFQCFSRIYLKSTLNTSNVDTQEIKYLNDASKIKSDFEEMKAAISKSDKHSPYNYFGLFIQQGGSPSFMSYLPAPNYLHNHKKAGGVVRCSACNSANTVKNGTKRGRNYYKCNDCDAQFSTPADKANSIDLDVDVWDEPFNVEAETVKL